MTKKLFDLAVKTGEYTDRSGVTKGRFLNVGSLMEKDGRQFIFLNKHFNPAGVPDLSGRNSDTVMVGLYAPKESNAGNDAKNSNNATDDIPF